MNPTATLVLFSLLACAACAEPFAEPFTPPPTERTPFDLETLPPEPASIDLQPAQLEGAFGVLTLTEPEDAGIARLTMNPRGVEVYIDRWRADGAWVMVQLSHRGPLGEILPTRARPRIELALSGEERSSSALICSALDGELADAPARSATVERLGEGEGGLTRYELHFDNGGEDTFARFSL